MEFICAGSVLLSSEISIIHIEEIFKTKRNEVMPCPEAFNCSLCAVALRHKVYAMCSPSHVEGKEKFEKEIVAAAACG